MMIILYEEEGGPEVEGFDEVDVISSGSDCDDGGFVQSRQSSSTYFFEIY